MVHRTTVGDVGRRFTFLRGNICCSGLYSPSVTHTFLHCFPITAPPCCLVIPYIVIGGGAPSLSGLQISPERCIGAKEGKSGGKGKGAKGKTPKRAKRGKKRVRTWSMYIYKVLKQVHSDTGISNKAMNIMNSFINDVFDRLATEAST